jgi:hypothetical protein
MVLAFDAGSRRQWIRAALTASLAVVGGVGFAVGIAVAPTHQQTAALVFTWVVAVAMCWLAWWIIRRETVHGTVTFTTNGLVIGHPRLLRSAAAIGREQIEKIQFDAVGVHHGRTVLRFADPDDPDGLSYLYSSATGSPYPLLSHRRSPPNVAIIFSQPIAIDARRRPWTRFFAEWNGTVQKAVYRGDPIAGLLLALDETDSAEAAVAAWTPHSGAWSGSQRRTTATTTGRLPSYQAPLGLPLRIAGLVVMLIGLGIVAAGDTALGLILALPPGVWLLIRKSRAIETQSEADARYVLEHRSEMTAAQYALAVEEFARRYGRNTPETRRLRRSADPFDADL